MMETSTSSRPTINVDGSCHLPTSLWMDEACMDGLKLNSSRLGSCHRFFGHVVFE